MFITWMHNCFITCRFEGLTLISFEFTLLLLDCFPPPPPSTHPSSSSSSRLPSLWRCWANALDIMLLWSLWDIRSATFENYVKYKTVEFRNFPTLKTWRILNSPIFDIVVVVAFFTFSNYYIFYFYSSTVIILREVMMNLPRRSWNFSHILSIVFCCENLK